MKVQYWWFSQPRAAPWTAPKCLDPSHRAKQNNKQTNEEGQEEGWGNLVLYQWSAGPRNHMGGSKSCQFTWGEFTPHTNTHILQKHTKKKKHDDQSSYNCKPICCVRTEEPDGSQRDGGLTCGNAKLTVHMQVESDLLHFRWRMCVLPVIVCLVFYDLRKYLVWHGEGAYLRWNIFGLLQEEKEKEENMLET